MTIHKTFILTVFFLTAFGLIMLASASGFHSLRFGDPSSLFWRQVSVGLATGILGFFIGYIISPRLLRKAALPLLLMTFLLLLAVLVTNFGFELGGSRRWIVIGNISFQPSEIAKLVLILYGASWLASHRKDIRSFWKGLLPFLSVTIPLPLLILFEPNISNFGISLALLLALLFIAGARVSHLVGLVLASLLFAGIAFYVMPEASRENRIDRITALFNPHADPLESSYQLNQSLIAIGSGGLWGKGLGESTQKLGFLPEPYGDAIFSIIAEELGLVGVSFLILLYLIFFAQGIIISRTRSEPFLQYMAAGFVFLVIVQAFINIAAVSGLIPLTGVTLPFISFGGTSLAVFLTGSGIVAGIAKRF